MRALIMTVLVSFQLTACVAGDNAVPTEDDDASEVEDLPALEVDDSFELADHLDELHRLFEHRFDAGGPLVKLGPLAAPQ